MVLKSCVVCGGEFDAKNKAITCSKGCSKERKRKYERKYQRTYRKRPYVKILYLKYGQQYRQRSDIQAHRREYGYEYHQRPDVKAHRHKYGREYHQLPDVKARSRIKDSNRKARKLSLPNTLTTQQWGYALNYFNGCCAVCERPLFDLFGTHKAAMDHWVPLLYEGKDNPGTVASNIIPLCHGEGGCNNSKSATMPHIWLRRKYSGQKAQQIEKRIAEYFEHVKGLES